MDPEPDNEILKAGDLSQQFWSGRILVTHLKSAGYVTVKLTDDDAASLKAASLALGGQVAEWAQQGAPASFGGFSKLSGKSRIEYCPGFKNLGNLGVLQNVANQVMAISDTNARTWLDRLGEGIGLRGKELEGILDTPWTRERFSNSCSLEAIQYTKAGSRQTRNRNTSSCPEHIDRGLLTVIFPDTEQGLEVFHEGEWKGVRIPAGCVAVLPGFTLERATCGLVKATMHRVVMGSSGDPPVRNSLVYKLRAQNSAVLDFYAPLMDGTLYWCEQRYRRSISVAELMHFFDAIHTSINITASGLTSSNKHSRKRTHQADTVSDAVSDTVHIIDHGDPEGVPVTITIECVGSSIVPQMKFQINQSTIMGKVKDALAEACCGDGHLTIGYPVYGGAVHIHDHHRCRDLRLRPDSELYWRVPMRGD